MKFRGGIILFTLIININGIALANEPTNSKIGITFYQNDAASQVVPMQKVAQPTKKSPKQTAALSTRPQYLPQTSEDIAMGMVWIGLGLICYTLIKNGIKKILVGKRTTNEKS
ncbi:hypothetical protein ACW5BZ_04955 [Pediococcus pentosaceus]